MCRMIMPWYYFKHLTIMVKWHTYEYDQNSMLFHHIYIMVPTLFLKAILHFSHNINVHIKSAFQDLCIFLLVDPGFDSQGMQELIKSIHLMQWI